MSVFEVLVGVAVLAVVAAIWIYNRTKRSEDQLHFDPTILAISIMVLAAGAVAIWRTGVATEKPLEALILAIICLNTVLIAWDLAHDRNSSKRIDLLADRFSEELAGLGNIRFYETKELTFRSLCATSDAAVEKLMATRFSPADISTESNYWNIVKKRAFDPKILTIRIHCLASHKKTAVDGVAKLVREFAGARNFRLGIAFYNNSFELIITDDHQCMFCFHDLEMTIKNGFSIDGTQPGNEEVVRNLGNTYRQMLSACYLTIDFERYVKTLDDAERLIAHLKDVHSKYCSGELPTPVPMIEMQPFLDRLVGR